MKKIAVITTGGTIASKYNQEGRLLAGAMSGKELCANLQLPNNIEIDIHPILQKPSPHFSFVDLEKIRETIGAIFKNPLIAGIVVTHGTDTLEETAYYLDLTIDDPRPIVVTGSQRSPEQSGSDAPTNLRDAIHSVCDDQLRNTGTVVIFNERVYAARYVKKAHSYNVQGFTAFGFGYLGVVDQYKLLLFQKPISQEKHIPIKKEIPVIEIIKCYLDADDKLIRACIAASVDGIILEGFGRGHIPLQMVPAIKDAIASGIHVVITTSAEEGEISTTYDYAGSGYDLYQAGVISGRDYDSKKARIKLLCLLRSGDKISTSL